MTIWPFCVASYPGSISRLEAPSACYDICFTVVTYGAYTPLNKTTRSIFKFINLFSEKKVALVVWSNGPFALEEPALMDFKNNIPAGCDVVVCEDTSNTALSDVYNRSIASIDANLHCMLDDDSELRSEFVTSLCSVSASDVLVPMIMVNDALQGPVLNGTFIGAGQYNLRPTDDFFAIASGLTLTKEIISQLKARFGQVFDCAYALYGVDTSFCLRLVELSRAGPVSVLCAGHIDHDLSRLNPNVARSAFRRRERGLDLGITLRRYPRWKFWRAMLASFVRAFSRSRTKSFTHVVRGYIAGRHPRSSPDRH